jgi:hypothetical protein
LAFVLEFCCTQASAAADNGSTITLLYYLTKRAMCQWMDQPYAGCEISDEARGIIGTKAAALTAWGNLALANSNVAYVYEIAFVHVDLVRDEGLNADVNTQLDWIQASTAVAALRDKYHADLVVDVFYMAGNSAAGIAFVPTSFPDRSYGFSSQAGLFSVVSCVSGPYIWAGMFRMHISFSITTFCLCVNSLTTSLPTRLATTW